MTKIKTAAAITTSTEVQTFQPASATPKFAIKREVKAEWKEVKAFVVLGKNNPENDNVLYNVVKSGKSAGKGIVFTPANAQTVEAGTLTLSFSVVEKGQQFGGKFHLPSHIAEALSAAVVEAVDFRLEALNDGNTMMFSFKALPGSFVLDESGKAQFMWYNKVDLNSFEILAGEPSPAELGTESSSRNIQDAVEAQEEQVAAAQMLRQIARKKAKSTSDISDAAPRRLSPRERLQAKLNQQ